MRTVQRAGAQNVLKRLDQQKPPSRGLYELRVGIYVLRSSFYHARFPDTNSLVVGDGLDGAVVMLVLGGFDVTEDEENESSEEARDETDRVESPV